jgi:integrase/recombinase XerD
MVNYEDEEYLRKNESLNKEIKGLINEKLILGYTKHLELKGRSIATITSNKGWLNTIFRDLIKKEWDKVTHDDIEDCWQKINNNSKWGEKYKSTIKKMIVAFDIWHNKGVRSIKTIGLPSAPNKRKLTNLQRSDLLTDDDKKKLIRSAGNKRDTAIISIWLETGLRPKEIRVLQVGSVTIEKDLAWITLPQDTKTGSRPIPIYYSKPYLIDWLNEHPAKDNPRAPLWINIWRKNEILPLNRKGFYFILNQIVKRSGIKKRIYWYLGRHSSYTDKSADGWSESIIKQYHGIDQSSSVLNRYIHLSATDVGNKVKEYYGLEKSKRKKPELTIVTCMNCSKEQSSANVRCSKCGYIIDPKLMAEELEKKNKQQEHKDKEMADLKKQMDRMNKILEAMQNEKKIKPK